MNKPQPIRYSRKEGSEWIPWFKCHQSGEAHAIMFSDGSVFDLCNGWREVKYCPCCGARKFDEAVE